MLRKQAVFFARRGLCPEHVQSVPETNAATRKLADGATMLFSLTDDAAASAFGNRRANRQRQFAVRNGAAIALVIKVRSRKSRYNVKRVVRDQNRAVTRDS